MGFLKVLSLPSITGVEFFMCPFIKKGEEKKLEFYQIYIILGANLNTLK